MPELGGYFNDIWQEAEADAEKWGCKSVPQPVPLVINSKQA